MLVSVLYCFLLGAYAFAVEDLEELFKQTKIVPDVLEEAPKEKLMVKLENGLEVGDNMEVKPADTLSAPNIDWPLVDAEKFYTVYMGCPDAPDPKDPRWSESLHWLVVNVPGNQIDKGDEYCPFVGLFPPKNVGFMRYVYLVYEQPNKMKFDEKVIDDNDGMAHMHFKIKKFAEKYKLGTPVAGNIIRAQWDEMVPQLHTQLGLVLKE
ncbi:putative odorant-binding protein A5 [Stomoxys calcitrans]|uniref:Odorant-binding protein A5 n=1 Tax=Stomoxys calcitrans TaxID=35570 RepID=A0A1I8P1V3_STOCA|nr:putative odorant-binding protein A5 [Stomoxys calcitrans]